MCDRRIDGNDKVQILDQRGGVGKIMQVVGPIDDRVTQSTGAQLPHCIVALLQTIEVTRGELKNRCELIERHASLAVDAIGAGQFLAWVSGPHQANAGLFMLAQTFVPRTRFALTRGKVGRRRGYGLKQRRERQRQAEQRAMKIECGERVAFRYDLDRAAERVHHLLQRLLHLQDHMGAARGDERCVTAELDGVAEALLGMEENGLALDLLRPEP